MTQIRTERILSGQKVSTPTKPELARAVADLLGIAEPRMSSGSTVTSELLTRIYEHLTGESADRLGAYAKTATILDRLGLTYDPHWDTSEAQEAGGSTVTSRAFSRMRSAISGVPRCFLLNRTDAKEGIAWESEESNIYRYDTRVTGRRPLNEAGPGSLIVYYNTSSDSRAPMRFTASALVQYISPGWKGPWAAELIGYEEFAHPVPASMVLISGRNKQHAITEINDALFRAMVETGLGTESAQAAYRASGVDVGGARAASRVDINYPIATIDVVGDDVPDRADGFLPGVSARLATYTETAEGVVVGDRHYRGATEEDRVRDKLVEERAITAATRHLLHLGWSLHADRQRDGMGYDLEFANSDSTIHLEVKGIRGANLEFNLTAKEWWRAQTDSAFLVAAVTGALNPHSTRVNLLSREEIVQADRTPTQFRVRVRRAR